MTSHILAGVVGLAFGAAGLIYYLLIALVGIAAYRWPRASGRITMARVEREFGHRLPNWVPKVTYSYEVSGTPHNGSRISFWNKSRVFQSRAQAIVDRYPVGGSVTVRYDPADPSLAVLQPGLGLELLSAALFFALLLLAGLDSFGLL